MYEWFGGGFIAEGGASGYDVGRVLGLIEGLLGKGSVLFGYDVVDGLRHLLLFLFSRKKLCN
jgi:hypothetical protein